MSRAEILDQITQTFGAVPGWLGGMPDTVLEQYWPVLSSKEGRP